MWKDVEIWGQFWKDGALYLCYSFSSYCQFKSGCSLSGRCCKMKGYSLVYSWSRTHGRQKSMIVYFTKVTSWALACWLAVTGSPQSLHDVGICSTIMEITPGVWGLFWIVIVWFGVICQISHIIMIFNLSMDIHKHLLPEDTVFYYAPQSIKTEATAVYKSKCGFSYLVEMSALNVYYLCTNH